jgi:DNA-directed RNA polymerase subunit RPC12/RpoP
MSDEMIDDGFDQSVSAWCPECGHKSMQVVRPGVFRCVRCETRHEWMKQIDRWIGERIKQYKEKGRTK